MEDWIGLDARIGLDFWIGLDDWIGLGDRIGWKDWIGMRDWIRLGDWVDLGNWIGLKDWIGLRDWVGLGGWIGLGSWIRLDVWITRYGMNHVVLFDFSFEQAHIIAAGLFRYPVNKKVKTQIVGLVMLVARMQDRSVWIGFGNERGDAHNEFFGF